MSLLKSAFVEDVTDEAKPVVQPREIPPPPPVGTSAAADPAAMSKLEALIQASVSPIYSTWMEKFTQLADVVPDEAMRFKAALKTSNATPVQLSAAVGQLLGAMTKAHDDFLRGFEGQSAKVESAAKEAVASTEVLIQSRESLVKAIQDELASLRSKLATEATHLRDERQRLEGIRHGFEAAHAQVVGRLNAQKDRIDAMTRG